MEEDKGVIVNLDDIKKEVGVIDFETVKKEVAPIKEEIVEKVNEPVAKEIIGEIHKQAIISTVQNSDEVKQQILDQAEKSISNELDSIEQESINRKQQTTYDANKEACMNYGVDSSVPLWQVKLIKLGSSIWFVIYWVFATFTFCPVNVFFKGIKSFIKSTWVAIIFAFIVYVILFIGLPVVLSYLKSQSLI